MVSTKEIVAANAAFAAKRTSEKVFVLTGATSGIGAATMQKLASMVDTATFYVAGRSAPRFSPLRAKVEALNPNIRIVFFECNVALLADMDAFSGHIAASEKSVDYLCMSQGMLPFTGARCTSSPTSLPRPTTDTPGTPQTPPNPSNSASPSRTSPAPASSRRYSPSSATAPPRASSPSSTAARKPPSTLPTSASSGPGAGRRSRPSPRPP